jgi:hypothetical protein
MASSGRPKKATAKTTAEDVTPEPVAKKEADQASKDSTEPGSDSESEDEEVGILGLDKRAVYLDHEEVKRKVGEAASTGEAILVDYATPEALLREVNKAQILDKKSSGSEHTSSKM